MAAEALVEQEFSITGVSIFECHAATAVRLKARDPED